MTEHATPGAQRGRINSSGGRRRFAAAEKARGGGGKRGNTSRIAASAPAKQRRSAQAKALTLPDALRPSRLASFFSFFAALSPGFALAAGGVAVRQGCARSGRPNRALETRIVAAAAVAPKIARSLTAAAHMRAVPGGPESAVACEQRGRRWKQRAFVARRLRCGFAPLFSCLGAQQRTARQRSAIGAARHSEARKGCAAALQERVARARNAAQAEMTRASWLAPRRT
jgi:hypothetical protein